MDRSGARGRLSWNRQGAWRRLPMEVSSSLHVDRAALMRQSLLMAISSDPVIGAEFDYRPAWRRDDPRVEADAIAFWNRLGILPPGVAPEQRAKELAAAAYKDGQLVAVTTATLDRLEFLRARFAMLRAAVDPGLRRKRAAWGLTLFTRRLIEQWSYDHPEEKVAGLGAIIEAPELVARQREPYWPTTRLGLVGYTPQGRQIRISWFDQYRLD